MDIPKLLADFSAISGVAGQEDGIADFCVSLLAPYGPVGLTPLGSVLCQVWNGGSGAPHLLIDAHIDEVGLIVTFIEEDGFLRVAPCGGIDRRALPAAPLLIYGEHGPVCGVVCSSPPHLNKEGEKKTLPVDELCVDIGCASKDEAEGLVSPGDRATCYAPARPLLGGLISGKAADNRAGCAAIMYALSLLADDSPAVCSLTVLFSTMEEIGGQGAKTAANHVLPTHAIIVDASFAHTPDAPKAKCGLLGGGPMVGIAPILSGEMSKLLIDTAKTQGIPFQAEVMGGKTGTNADSIAVAGAGVYTGLLSIPQKYMHTPVETVSISDIENTGRLLAAFIRRFNREWGPRL